MAKGVGREDAHKMIKDHAVAAIKAGAVDSFIDRLVEDKKFPLDRVEIELMVAKPNHGAAWEQVKKVCLQIENLVALYPEAADYMPEPLL